MPHALSQLLYFCRWIGTLLVLSVHARAVFVGFPKDATGLEAQALEVWRFFVSYEFGRQGVVGFFVMSGFLVGGSVIEGLRGGKAFLLDYFIHRVARIYLVLLPAIAITIALDGFGRAFLADSGVYELPPVQGHHKPWLILTDLLNLQGIVAKYYGTNGPLWSVAYEFWYYLIFPLLLLPLATAYPARAARRGCALGVVLFAAFTIPQLWFLIGFILWGLGAAATLPQRPLMRSIPLAAALFLIVGVILRAAVGETLESAPALVRHAYDIVSALFFANLLLTLRFTRGAVWRPLRGEHHRRLADFSFTLYAIHAPLLLFMAAIVRHGLPASSYAREGAPLQWALMGASIAVVIVSAYVLSRVTETRTGATRRFLRRHIDRLAGRQSGAPTPARGEDGASALPLAAPKE